MSLSVKLKDRCCCQASSGQFVLMFTVLVIVIVDVLLVMDLADQRCFF